MNMTDENLTIEGLAADVAVRRLSTTISELRYDLPHASDETLYKVRDLLHQEARYIIRRAELWAGPVAAHVEVDPAPLDELFGFDSLSRDGGEYR